MRNNKKNHRDRVRSRNNRIEGQMKRLRRIFGIRPGEIVFFRRFKATEFSPPVSKGSIFNWGEGKNVILDAYGRVVKILYYQDSDEFKKGGFGTGRVVSVYEKKGGRVINLRTLDNKWDLSVEEKFVRRMETEEEDLFRSLDDIGQI